MPPSSFFLFAGEELALSLFAYYFGGYAYVILLLLPIRNDLLLRQVNLHLCEIENVLGDRLYFFIY